MKQRWSLYVEDFGKIQKAEIEVSPLMIFLGDNNSGKSYLMSLLWGLINKSYTLLIDGNDVDFFSYKQCEKWLHSLDNRKDVLIDNHVKQMIVSWFNEILDKNKEDLSENIFNKYVEIGNINLRLIEGEDFKVNLDHLEGIYNKGQMSIFDLVEKDKNIILANLCYYVLFSDYKKLATNVEEPLFLPASRTGFMLTYKTLLKESVRSSFGNEKSDRSKFTTPIINFLNRFVNLDVDANKEYLDAVKFIEKELIKGRIVKDESPVKNIYYKPSNLNDNLPLYLTSSLVTEVTPLILFLSDANSYFKTLVIEEPEAHLHLKAQIIMARVVAMLINQGTNVWLTTHSDTFFQQINNLIKLNAHNNKEELLKEFGFTENECLDVDDIRVYEFDIENDKTKVIELQGSETGFPSPTFNEVIYKLTNEVMTLEEGEDD
ncbi:AAA family ATPase [Tepidibacter mesophilus]|uniref:AAA family ATPase n=1 Tax=Tepidibacter mesophilus TaxID=655607 RepID=UPI000C071CBE|nr:AAA family ATPase [Tepidibacter mesophilus]